MSLIEHHRHAMMVLDYYVGASGTRYANLDKVGLLERWLDVFDDHLVTVDILDYPGAEERADAAMQAEKARLSSAPGAVFEYNPGEHAITWEATIAEYFPEYYKRSRRGRP